jgi:helicase required for RNAi-mediated heterochromatin assembly 1
LEYEQLQGLEQEAEEYPEDKFVDALRGTTIAFGRTLTGRCPVPVEDRKIKRLLSSKKNLHDIHMGMRGHVYRYFEKQLNNLMLAKLKQQLREYKSTTDDLRIVQVRSHRPPSS